MTECKEHGPECHHFRLPTATEAIAIEQAENVAKYWVRIMKERDQLRAENEKLKAITDFDRWKKEYDKVEHENQKLRQRMAYLREALKDALAQDDEDAKG